MSDKKLEKIKYKNSLKSLYDEMNKYMKDEDPRFTIKQRQIHFVEEYRKNLTDIKKVFLYTKGEIPSDYLHAVYYFNTFIMDLNKQLPHIFIENRELEDFFKNTKVHNLDTVRNYLEDNTDFNHYTDGKTKSLAYVLHTPEECYIVNAFYRESENHGKNYYLICWNSKEENQYVELNEDIQHFTKPIDGSNTPPLLLNVAVNSMMYMSAFPECIIGGVPQNIVKNDKEVYKEKKNLTLKTSEIIIEKCERDSSGHIVTPHFRSGSFHYLKSDHYKEKKGKTVWWSPSMVKGHAKTLKDSKDKDEELDLTR